MATTTAVMRPVLMAETNLSSALSLLPEERKNLTLTSEPLSSTSQPELKDLSAAIVSFQRCYEDLLNDLYSIKSAMLSKPTLETPSKLEQSEVSTEPNVSEASAEPDASEASPKPDVFDGKVLQTQQQQNCLDSELEVHCKSMCSRSIRKYLQTHVSNLSRMREEVPKALKLAPNAPKLVLESLGKFYLQGSKAFNRKSPLIQIREASIFILECFLLMTEVDTAAADGKDIEKAVKVEADKAALTWWKRLVVEGGLLKANKTDARGLLLLVACFGIPDSFKRDDILDLTVASDADEISGLLQKSRVLMARIPEIVEWLVKHQLVVDAVDLVYIFGLEARFNPQNILLAYLRESSKKRSHGSAVSSNEANKKQLAALKSVRMCLEKHKVDTAKLLPGLQINEKITTLENDISKSGERKSSERKETETASKNPRTRRTFASHSGGRRNMSNNGQTNRLYPASTPVVYGGSDVGILPESMALSDSILSAAPYDRHVTSRGGEANPYAWHRDSRVNERFPGQCSSLGGTWLTSSLYGGSTSMEGFAGELNDSSIGSDIYQFFRV